MRNVYGTVMKLNRTVALVVKMHAHFKPGYQFTSMSLIS